MQSSKTGFQNLSECLLKIPSAAKAAFSAIPNDNG